MEVEGKYAARKHQHLEVMWHAWHAAVLPNMGKKFPRDFGKWAGLDEGPKGPLPAAEIMARMEGMRMAWRARSRKVVRKLPKGGQRPGSPPTVAR